MYFYPFLIIENVLNPSLLKGSTLVQTLYTCPNMVI